MGQNRRASGTQRIGAGRRSVDRRSRYSIRPAALLVVILAGTIAIFGARTIGSSEDPVVPSPTSVFVNVQPTQADVVENALPTVIPTVASSPTLPPPVATRTPLPTVEPTEEPEPTPTSEPESTERPVAPPTGVDDASYIYQRGESGRKEVAFTFDAGEGPGDTAAILDILDEYGVKGSFGVTGQWAEQNPDLLKRIVDEGHMLINHTYDHASWSGASKGTEPLTDAQRMEEVKKTEEIVWEITGYELQPFFRFPYGDYDQASLVTLKEAGYDYTLWWTCDTQAWGGNTADTIEQLCAPDAELGGPGAIVLMHVVQDQDLKALPELIEAYQAEGYDIVTMEQMVQP